VLVGRRCYPNGCIRFLWKCKLLGKGGTCPQGYRHVGNNCAQCRHYDEEKIRHRPELVLGAAEFADFLEDCRRFDEWMAAQRGSRREAGGEISDVRPHLVRRIDGHRASLVLRGFLLRLSPAFVGLHGIEDPLYIRLTRGQQERHRLAPGDRIECEGYLELDRGRLVIHLASRLRVEARSGAVAAAWDQALVDRIGAARIHGQPERCLRCPRGVLVDVEALGNRPGPSPGRRRELLCLEGIGRPEDCPYEALQSLRGECPGDSCTQPQARGRVACG